MIVDNPPRTSRRFNRIQVEPPEAKRLDVVSINWCDRTTWYPSSVRVEDEVLADSGDSATYNPETQRAWIDVMHGKLTGEYSLRPMYQVVVKVNGTTKTENPVGTSNGDYSINYETGQVTFNSSLAPTDVVTASYNYENGSTWTIKPSDGRTIRITTVEVQFSADLVLTDTVLFEAHGLVDVFAPHLVPAVPSGTVIPLGNQAVYQVMQDYINEAERAYPSIPKLGGTGWRGMPQEVHIFRWPYSSRGTTDLVASMGLEIHIKLENDIPFEGEIGIVTFYGISEEE